MKQGIRQASTLKCKDFENSYTYDLINRAQYDANTGVLGSIKIFFSLTSLDKGTQPFVVCDG